MCDERLSGKPRRKGYVWFLWVASVCDRVGRRAQDERNTMGDALSHIFLSSGMLNLKSLA